MKTADADREREREHWKGVKKVVDTKLRNKVDEKQLIYVVKRNEEKRKKERCKITKRKG